MTEADIMARFTRTREQSLAACEPLYIEDYGLQAEAFTSPPKWHLAHTSWFFETFLLKPFARDYRTPDERYEFLFNSYYNGVGAQFSRAQRGLLSRPGVEDIRHYRAHVDRAMTALLGDVGHPQRETILARCRLGVEHEQQHQELFYTDLKYSLYANPIAPAYSAKAPLPDAGPAVASEWREYGGGLVTVGREAAAGQFAFDNEGPVHSVFLAPFALARRLVTNREFQAFVDDGGYRRPEFWLADGWAIVQEQQWQQPLYWQQRDGVPMHFTLHGLQPRQPWQPVCHLSGYEADAYASWADARLPTEFEWESAASAQGGTAARVDPPALHPGTATGDEPLLQLFDQCWQWTGSAYRPYPGFKPAAGAIGEYNGKFMANQWVLRGGACVTARGHTRASYRNFFYPQDRWQFSGVRLARDL
ncbi:MAG: ergothioneine biosynthesis protein EgtB [Halioglobus sp.]|nr:ergothioneine biosynthesis protein EgtB [Halioglobus sp.]